MPPTLPNSASTGIFAQLQTSTTDLVNSIFSSKLLCEPSIITEVYPALNAFIASSKLFPWSRCIAIGTFAFSAATFAFAKKNSTSAYFTVDGVVCIITGEFNSSAASTTAITISIFSTLKAPTA